MYDKYDYIIKSVTSKRGDGYVNKYHSKIVGARCTPGSIEVAYRGAFLIDALNQEDTHWRNWYYTSPVEEIHYSSDGVLVIETKNSTYVLEKIDE